MLHFPNHSKRRATALWERRQARCSSPSKPKHRGFRRSHKSRSTAPVGAPEGAMLFAHRSHKHRGCRRSHKSRSTAPVGAPEGAMLFAHRSQSIAAAAAPTKAERGAPVGAPEGAMLFAHRSQSIAAAAAPTTAKARRRLWEAIATSASSRPARPARPVRRYVGHEDGPARFAGRELFHQHPATGRVQREESEAHPDHGWSSVDRGT
jgi:hypothetical protein